MPLVDLKFINSLFAVGQRSRIPRLAPIVSVVATFVLSTGGLTASAASLTRSVDVEGTPSTVWLMIGPFCAIKDWLPADWQLHRGRQFDDSHARNQGRQSDVRRKADRAQRYTTLL